MSAERRGLHERIDTLQAELVDRHKSGTGLGGRPAVMTDPVGHDGDRFVKELPERFNELGSFIREQRSSARLSLRRLSELAGISNPYLSQIERGLRRPSAEILQQIAKALRISAETLYVQAGILERPDGDTDLSRHIFADQPPHRGAAPGPDADLPVVPARERGPGGRRSRHRSDRSGADPRGPDVRSARRGPDGAGRRGRRLSRPSR